MPKQVYGIEGLDRLGKSTLIDGIKQREGFYVMFEAEIEPRAIGEIERQLNLAPAVLRYLFVRTDE